VQRHEEKPAQVGRRKEIRDAEQVAGDGVRDGQWMSGVPHHADPDPALAGRPTLAEPLEEDVVAVPCQEHAGHQECADPAARRRQSELRQDHAQQSDDEHEAAEHGGVDHRREQT
jgi:hypothetical protein